MDTYPIRKTRESHKDMLEMLAHDLRTPMCSVAGAAQMALLRQKQGKDVGVQLEQILGAVETMDRMLSQICGGGQRGVTAKALENELRAIIAPRAAVKGLRLCMEFSALGEGEWALDRGRLCRVLSNLLVNAVKFTPPGGGVSLRASVSGEPGRNAAVTFFVSDSGTGMKTGFQKEMFRAHARAQETAHLPGQGLGLTIVQRLVGEMGGTVSAQSEWGRGTTFAVRIPLDGGALQ